MQKLAFWKIVGTIAGSMLTAQSARVSLSVTLSGADDPHSHFDLSCQSHAKDIQRHQEIERTEKEARK
jgi:hypothetical protein